MPSTGRPRRASLAGSMHNGLANPFDRVGGNFAFARRVPARRKAAFAELGEPFQQRQWNVCGISAEGIFAQSVERGTRRSGL